MGTPFSVTVSGGRAGAGTSDGSFSVPAGKVLEIRDITGYIRPDAAGSDIVIGPFVSTYLAGAGYLHTLVPPCRHRRGLRSPVQHPRKRDLVRRGECERGDENFRRDHLALHVHRISSVERPLSRGFLGGFATS